MSLNISSDIAAVRAYIRQAFSNYFKQAEGLLRHPFVSPGAQYAKDLWDWDSYWFLFAVLEFARQNGDSSLLKDVTPYARGTLFNFMEHQGQDGSLPILICPNDDDPFDCTKSRENNMAKPFIGQLTAMFWEHQLVNRDETAKALKCIMAFHRCYEERYLHPGTGLLLWAKDWGLGDDDDPTTWGRPQFSCANIFLNVFLIKDLKAAFQLCKICGMPAEANECQTRISRLSAAIERFCWDEREKAYFSLDVQCAPNLSPHRKFRMLNVNLPTFWQGLKLKVLSWNCLLPFWAGLGTQEQFHAFIQENMVPGRLWSNYGVRSLSMDEPMYAPETARGNPSNWLGPIWIIANYIAWDTLKSRGETLMAEQLVQNIHAMLARDLAENKCFHEFYSPESGRGVMGSGMMSWNALAALMH